MYRTLSDLRTVRLALHLEETLEAYEEYLRDLLAHVPTRATLAPLFEDGPAHEALRRAFRQLERHANEEEKAPAAADVLLTMLDCETMAHDFCLRNLDRVSDPDLVRLFRELAAEERRHMDIVREALRLQREHEGDLPTERANVGGH